MKESVALAAEVALAFAKFEAWYPHKWVSKPRAVEVWTEILSDLTPEEVRQAVSAWGKSHDWPPSPAELRGKVPRLCRCGKCYSCHARAVERARRAIDRGSAGADFDTPERLSEIAPRNLPRLTQ